MKKHNKKNKKQQSSSMRAGGRCSFIYLFVQQTFVECLFSAGTGEVMRIE